MTLSATSSSPPTRCTSPLTCPDNSSMRLTAGNMSRRISRSRRLRSRNDRLRLTPTAPRTPTATTTATLASTTARSLPLTTRLLGTPARHSSLRGLRVAVPTTRGSPVEAADRSIAIHAGRHLLDAAPPDRCPCQHRRRILAAPDRTERPQPGPTGLVDRNIPPKARHQPRSQRQECPAPTTPPQPLTGLSAARMGLRGG